MSNETSKKIASIIKTNVSKFVGRIAIDKNSLIIYRIIGVTYCGAMEAYLICEPLDHHHLSEIYFNVIDNNLVTIDEARDILNALCLLDNFAKVKNIKNKIHNLNLNGIIYLWEASISHAER